MKKIALVHPELGLGGPDAVAAWILDILSDRFEVDLLLCRGVEISRIDNLYGTSLSKKDIEIKIVPMPNFIKDSAKGRLLKQHFLMRYCKRNFRHYDIMFSTYNEMDFGARGIQYIHFPSMDIAENARHNLMIDKWYYKKSLIRSAYLLAGKMVSGYQPKNVSQNLTLVNSDWTGNIVRSIHGCQTVTLYPPVPDDFLDSPWQERKPDFVYVGIISPDKKIETIISTLAKARKNGFNIRLHLIGRVRGEGSGYDTVFKELLQRCSDWVVYEGALPRQRMLEVVAQCKYAIHAKKEHFGISIAELTKAGCIPFVPNEGGHLEIIGNNKELLGFSDEDDAIQKITAVMSNVSLQDKIKQELKNCISRFSIQHFRDSLLKIVNDFMQSKGSVK